MVVKILKATAARNMDGVLADIPKDTEIDLPESEAKALIIQGKAKAVTAKSAKAKGE